MTSSEINNLISTLARERGVGQRNLAKAVGIAQSGLSVVLRSDKKWSESQIRAFAAALGVEPGRLDPGLANSFYEVKTLQMLIRDQEYKRFRRQNTSEEDQGEILKRRNEGESWKEIWTDKKKTPSQKLNGKQKAAKNSHSKKKAYRLQRILGILSPVKGFGGEGK